MIESIYLESKFNEQPSENVCDKRNTKSHISQLNSSFIEEDNSQQTTEQTAWNPSSWKSYSALQQPVYENKKLLAEQLQIISSLPSIVSIQEIEQLHLDLQLCEKGAAFFIQMGDCAERFSELSNQFIEKKVKAITAASRIFASILNKKCIKIGRMAGQFAKPRSQEYEQLADGTLQFNYRGDNVNSLEERKPDPLRLTEGYYHSAAAMNYIRANHKAIVTNKLAMQQIISDKQYTSSNQQEFVLSDATLTAIEDSALNNQELYTSHEGLLLNYEEMLTKEQNNKFYNTSAHLLWMGERTRQLNGAHIEFFSGINNPVAVKVGPTTDGETFKQLLHKLNPRNIQGRVVIICRMGNKNIGKVLQTLIDTKKQHNLNFVWSCDPMHGNTYSTSQNIKTRNLKDILEELTQFATILHSNNEMIGGIHLETSPIQVTECIGMEIEECNLNTCYTSACDPRLNISQTLQICNQFALLLQSLYNKSSTTSCSSTEKQANTKQ